MDITICLSPPHFLYLLKRGSTSHAHKNTVCKKRIVSPFIQLDGTSLQKFLSQEMMAAPVMHIEYFMELTE
jgi:hypothetical protein